MRAYGIRQCDQWGTGHRKDEKAEGRRVRRADPPNRAPKRRARRAGEDEIDAQYMEIDWDFPFQWKCGDPECWVCGTGGPFIEEMIE
jgi:hypothetical protein